MEAAVGNCQDARTLVEVNGITLKLAGASLGAERKKYYNNS